MVSMQMPGMRLVPGGGVFYVGPRIVGRALAVGDLVRWDSTMAGTWSQKEGRVIEVVPAGCRPSSIRSAMTRDHESYVVRSGDRVLWPAASAVRIR